MIQVWGKHKENLILMERYHFFASSCRQFGFNCKSLSQERSDESETDGALATILRVLQKIHSIFFDSVGLISVVFGVSIAFLSLKVVIWVFLYRRTRRVC